MEYTARVDALLSVPAAMISDDLPTTAMVDEMSVDLTFEDIVLAPSDEIAYPSEEERCTQVKSVESVAERVPIETSNSTDAISNLDDPDIDDNCSVSSEISLHAPSLS